MDPNSLWISVPPDKPTLKISLDDIDLSLLHSYKATVPLYTLQSREYIDFEVYAQEIPILPDDENLDIEDVRLCHICEVDVPVSYWECHKASTKHQVYNAITQVSLDRLRKQTELDILPLRPSIPRASMYYCESCSKPVHCTQQDSHNESNEHVTNKNLDEMMKNLMLVYKNPADFTNIFNQANQAAIKEEKRDPVIEKHDSVIEKHDPVIEKHDPVIEKHDPVIITRKKLDWWDEVFLYPKKVNPLTAHEIYYIDNNTVAIITKSEAKLAVNFDNFHGFRKDINKTVCQVCWVSVDDKYTHMNNHGHIKKMIVNIEDKHCLRQVAPKSIHCILCNEITDNRDEHINTERHETSLKQATIDDELYQDMRKDFERYDTKINTHQSWWEKVFLYPKKVNPKTVHKIQYVDDSTIEVDVRSGAKLALGFDNFHGFCEDAEKIICRVCRALVEDKYTHMYDDGHIKKITATIEDKHCIRQLDEIFNHCILCNEIIENSEVHISTEKHEIALNDCLIDDSNEVQKTLADNSMSVSSFDKRVYFCNACQIYVELNSLTLHINEEYHTEALGKSKKRRWRIQPKINIAASEYCNICNVNITGRKKKHKKTDDHRYLKWLTKKDSKLHHHLIKIKKVDNVICKVCKISITSDQLAKQHIASSTHEDLYKQLLQQNKMETLDHKYVSCHACNTRILAFEDLHHIESSKHKKCLHKKQAANMTLHSGIDKKVTSTKFHEIIQNGFQVKGNDWYCIYCTVTMEQKYIDDHIKSESHASSKLKHDQVAKPQTSVPENSAAFNDNDSSQLVTVTTNIKEDIINTRKALYEKLKEEMFDGDYCTVCKVPVKATEQIRRNHMIWSDHRYKFYLHTIKENARWHHHMTETFGSDNLICQICLIQVKPDNDCVQRHIDSNEHVAKFRSLTGNLLEKISESRVRCRLCKLTMLCHEEINHFSTARHIKNLRQKGYVHGILGTIRKNTKNEKIISDEPKKNTNNEKVNSYVPEEVEDVDEETMRSNDLIKTGTEYFCNACQVTVEHNFIDIHIDSDMHRINISRNIPAKENHTQDDITVKPKLNKKLHYVYDIDDKFDVKCKICNVGVSFDRMVKHRQEESHKENFRNVLADNTMFRIHYISFCECCMEIVMLNSEYEHFTSEKHVNNLSKLTNRMDRKKVVQIAESMFRKYDADYRRVRKNKWFNPVSSLEVSGTIASESLNSSTSTDSEKDYPFPNETLVFNNSTVDCTDNNTSLDADKLDCSESDISFASALTSITETNPSNTVEVADDKNYEPNDASLCVPPTYAYLFREKNPKQLNCEVCESSVSVRCDLIIEHVQGKKHYKKYLSFLAANNITEDPGNGQNLQKYHCSKCGIDFPDTQLFSHVIGKTHCMKVNQPSACMPQATNPNEVTVFNFIPDIPMYYWCKSYDNDPFYLLSTISLKSKLIKTLDDPFSNSTKKNIGLDTSICYWRESYDNDPFYLLSIISQKSNFPITADSQVNKSCDITNQNFARDIPMSCRRESDDNDPFYLLSIISQKSKLLPSHSSKSSDSTNQNFARDIPMYHWRESYDKDPFYLLSAISQKSKPSAQDIPSKSDVNVKQNFTPDMVNVAHMFKYFLYEHYDPARVLGTHFYKSVPPKLGDKTDQKTEVEHQGTTFSKNIKDGWSDESTELSSQALSQVNTYANILKNSTGSRSDASTKQKTQEESQSISAYNFSDYYDPARVMSTVVPNAILSGNMIDKQSKESSKQNSPLQSQNTSASTYYLYDHYDPARVLSTVVPNAILSGKMVDEQLYESTKPNAQLESHNNMHLKYLIDNQTQESTKLKTQPEDQENNLGGNRFEVSMKSKVEPGFQENTYANILKKYTESRSDNNEKQSAHLENQGNTQLEHQKNTSSKVLEEKNTTTAQSATSISQSQKLSEVFNKFHGKDSFGNKLGVVDSFCHVCQVKLPDGASGIKIHVNGAIHRKNLEKHIKTTNAAPLKPNENSDSVPTNDVVNDFCCVCKVKVSTGGNNISEHVTGARHRENKAIAEKRQIKTDPATPRPSVAENSGSVSTNHVVNGFCSVCEVKVPTGSKNIAAHVNGANHLHNVAIAEKRQTKTDLVTPRPAVTGNSGFMPINYVVNGFCSVCEVKVPTGSKNIAEHVKGANHLHNVAISEKRQTKTDLVTPRPSVAENSGSLPINYLINGICSVCKVKVPTGRLNIAQHVKEANHLQNVANAEKRKNTNNSASATSNSQKDLSVYNSIPNSNERLCTVCNVKVSNSNQNLHQHLNGALHKENLDNLIMFDLVPTNERLCKICKVKVPNKADNIHEHLHGQNHKRNAEKGQLETKSIATEAFPTETQSVLLTKPTTSSHLRYIREGVHCYLCNVIMNDFGSIVSHLNSEKHVSFSRKLEQELLSETARVPDLVPASVNSVSSNNSAPMSVSADTSRTNSRDSSAMRQSANSYPKTNGYICKICNVEVPNNPNNINDHIAGNRHKVNVAKLNSTEDINSAPNAQNLSSNKQDNIAKLSGTTIKNSHVPNDEIINKPSTSHAQKSKDCNIITPTTDTSTSYDKKAENENTAKDSENGDGFFICKTCKVSVENNPTAIHSHLNSYKHNNNTQEQKEKMKEELQEQKLYFCEVCRSEISDNSIKIKAHNDSLYHMKKFLELLSLNKIRIRDNKVCYCELCDLYFNKFSVLAHIERETHKKKMA